MIHVEISGDFALKIKSSLVKHAVNTTLAHVSIAGDSSLTIVISGDEDIQELNLKYRGIDSPTDVLSFPAGHLDPESGATYLGDVILSYPQAVAQARNGNHPIDDELQLLIVHGVLHLLGYDHGEPAPKNHMWALQDEILKQLDVKIT